jgi:hypothetical protein
MARKDVLSTPGICTVCGRKVCKVQAHKEPGYAPSFDSLLDEMVEDTMNQAWDRAVYGSGSTAT